MYADNRIETGGAYTFESLPLCHLFSEIDQLRELPEWSNGSDSKSEVLARVPGVRIPRSLPKSRLIPAGLFYYMENLLNRITTDPDVCHGKPVIRGLRYPIESMLELMASGMTHQEILADYEDLEEEDLLACLLFAARLTKVKQISRLVA